MKLFTKILTILTIFLVVGAFSGCELLENDITKDEVTGYWKVQPTENTTYDLNRNGTDDISMNIELIYQYEPYSVRVFNKMTTVILTNEVPAETINQTFQSQLYYNYCSTDDLPYSQTDYNFLSFFVDGDTMTFDADDGTTTIFIRVPASEVANAVEKCI